MSRERFTLDSKEEKDTGQIRGLVTRLRRRKKSQTKHKLEKDFEMNVLKRFK